MTDRRPLLITSDRLLLVEGPDDRNLFEALIRHRLAKTGSDVQVVDVGGVNAFKAGIAAVRMAAVQATTPHRPAEVQAVHGADGRSVLSSNSQRSAIAHVGQRGFRAVQV